jgi:hypothetical protein
MHVAGKGGSGHCQRNVHAVGIEDDLANSTFILDALTRCGEAWEQWHQAASFRSISIFTFC